MTILKLKITLKVLSFCFIIGAIFILNNNIVIALAPNPGYWEAGKCQFSIPTEESCGECKHGTKPKGSGTIYCEGDDGGAVDFCLSMGITSSSVHGSQKTNVFFQDDAKADTITKIGKGYIGATVNYNHISKFDNSIIYSYILCDAIKIDDYDEWLEICNLLELAKENNHKVTVYPNPTSGDVYIELQLVKEYADSILVSEVRYDVFDSNQNLIFSETPNDIIDIVQIPSNYFVQTGVYFIKAYISLQSGGVEVIDVPLMFIK